MPNRTAAGTPVAPDVIDDVSEAVVHSLTTCLALHRHRFVFPLDDAVPSYREFHSRSVTAVVTAQEKLDPVLSFFERIGRGPVGIMTGAEERLSAHDACVNAAAMILGVCDANGPRSKLPHTLHEYARILRCVKAERLAALERAADQPAKKGRPPGKAVDAICEFIEELRSTTPPVAWTAIPKRIGERFGTEKVCDWDAHRQQHKRWQKKAGLNGR